MERVYVSKRDTWLMLVLGIAAVACLGAPWAGALEYGFSPQTMISIAVGTAVTAFLVLIPYTTDYTFGDEYLRVRSGPLRMRVALDQIRSASPTRNPLSSPACSLDRLRIAYGKRSVMISPLDKAGFLAELRLRCPNFEQDPEPAAS